MKYYYHGTTRTRLRNILKTGLIPRSERKSNIYLEGKKVDCICFTQNFKKAIYWANRKRVMDNKGNPIVITLDLRGLEILDTNSASNDIERCTLSKINKDRIVTYTEVPKKTESEVKKELGLYG